MENSCKIKGWVQGRFKEFAILQRGKDLTDDEVVQGPYPVVKSNGVQIYHNSYFVDPPGVVTGRSGTIGNVFYIEEPFWSHNTSLYVKDFKNSDPRFIYYLIQRMDFRRYYAGTTIPTLNRNDIHRLKVEVPSSKREQKAIAEILSKMDELIESTQNSIKAAERLKKFLLQNLLSGKLKTDRTWRSEGELTVTKYGMAPTEWKYCQTKKLIQDKYILHVQDGNHGELHPTSGDFVEEGIPFVMASDIANGYVDTQGCKKLPKSLADNLRIGFAKNGDVLISHKASIGYTCIIEDADPYFMLSPQVTYYRCDTKKLAPEYLLYFFQQHSFQCILEGAAKQSTRNYIGITNQKKMWIYLPDSVEEQMEVVRPLRSIDVQLKQKHSKIRSLKILKKALMQNLLPGKVRVDVDKINQILEEVN